MIGRARTPGLGATASSGDENVARAVTKTEKPATAADDAAERFPRRTARRQQTRARILDAALYWCMRGTRAVRLCH